MKKNSTILYTLAIILFASGAFWFFQGNSTIRAYLGGSIKNTGDNLAAVFFRESVTVEDIKNKYKNSLNGQNKVHVLVVPGHEANDGGAKYGKLKERDMVVDLGNYLVEFLNNDGHYKTTITRDYKSWNSVFSNYFATNWENIIAFNNSQKTQMSSLLNVGLMKPTTGAFHVNAAPEIALRLYGINKWANENDVDITIHIHFNDFPRKKQSLPGKYSGFVIYVPESQYSNSSTTKAVANSVFSRLAKYNAVSDLKTEDDGVVEDQVLIAVGSNNSANSASMLIEYGYIYEPQFQDPVIREIALKDLAYQTYLGLQDFFGQTKQGSAYDTLTLPYNWSKTISKTNAGNLSADVFALQSALMSEGYYPVQGSTKNDCPRSGVFGPCTTDAIKAFQLKYGVKGESGFFGPKTQAALESLYGS